MSPKNFRKICHPEAKILNSLVNCGQTLRRTDGQTRLDVELTPLPVGQLKIRLTINEDSKSLIESLYSTWKVSSCIKPSVIDERRTNKINKSCEVETSIGRRLYKERNVFRSYTLHSVIRHFGYWQNFNLKVDKFVITYKVTFHISKMIFKNYGSINRYSLL